MSVRSVSSRLILRTGLIFVALTATVLALNYVLVRRTLAARRSVQTDLSGPPPCAGASCDDELVRVSAQMTDASERIWTETLDTLARQTAWSVMVAASVAIGVGWLVTRRALAPIAAITAAARHIEVNDLHRRLDIEGPSDEIRDLAETFNSMLGRLEDGVEAQRRFAAAVSHELRTPLTVQRTLLEVTLDDRSTRAEEWREVGQQLREMCLRQQELIEGLLELAQVSRRQAPPAKVGLTDALREAVTQLSPAHDHRLRLTVIEDAEVHGHHALLVRLCANIVDNALKHGSADGEVDLTVCAQPGRGIVTLVVENDGPVLASAPDDLVRPFARDTTTSDDRGVGLGLTVAHEIVEMHGGSLVLQRRRGGGLRVAVSLAVASEVDREIDSAHVAG
ncbi:ATP-binding protein [Alloalcanivorax gelatiniphagus]